MHIDSRESRRVARKAALESFISTFEAELPRTTDGDFIFGFEPVERTKPDDALEVAECLSGVGGIIDAFTPKIGRPSDEPRFACVPGNRAFYEACADTALTWLEEASAAIRRLTKAEKLPEELLLDTRRTISDLKHSLSQIENPVLRAFGTPSSTYYEKLYKAIHEKMGARLEELSGAWRFASEELNAKPASGAGPKSSSKPSDGQTTLTVSQITQKYLVDKSTVTRRCRNLDGAFKDRRQWRIPAAIVSAVGWEPRMRDPKGPVAWTCMNCSHEVNSLTRPRDCKCGRAAYCRGK
jgi:hypothetical protein